METVQLASSPLNYTGGKFKLLPQIIPFFPDGIDTFVDLFCGGGNVGANVVCRNVIFNDSDKNLSLLLNAFKNLDENIIFQWIEETIDTYGLSKSSEFGYDYYQCNSSEGLGKYNRERFYRLRDDFNRQTTRDYRYYVTLYVLIVYAFNNQIRFNADGNFNLPVGKRDFNKAMQKKLSDFIRRLHEIESRFMHEDFRNIDFNGLTENDFVYADPPYLITCAAYNENGGWNEEKENSLLELLDTLNDRHIRFALSNVLTSKGKNNNLLTEWLGNHPNYNCHHLNFNYSNSNYQTKDRTSGSDEVLITNY